jgi:murein DD-endopeptidase MepM/ murein hydrolase activator NlpD
MKKYIWITLILLSGCNGGVVDRLLKKSSPYEVYLSSLESTALNNYALVKDWKAAGENSLKDSLYISIPYQEIGYFDPKEPEALVLKYQVEEGHQIDVSIKPVSQKEAFFFMDIFEVDPVEPVMERIHFADSSGSISYQVRNSGIHALRVQPELLRGGVFSLSIVSQGILAFPIANKSTQNIASFWGDPRDGDARKHEGVDVFASRGTPVVAASAGRVRRVGDNRLGGKVVWLSNSELGHSQYYAHLDSQLVQAGQQVNMGDTLGMVGNTGNAITTAPHLHFGIYKSGRGAVDPFPFLQELELPEETGLADSINIGSPSLIRAPLANIRSAPSTSANKIGSFEKGTYLEVEGKVGKWYRISLPNNLKGYIFENLVDKVQDPVREITLNPLDEVWENWEANAPITGDIISGEAKVWGKFENNFYVETVGGIKGWWKIK